jgi:peptidoglycan hydrolase-like protein with peptidoglycan-binding domain
MPPLTSIPQPTSAEAPGGTRSFTRRGMRPFVLATSALLMGALVGSAPPSAGQPIVTLGMASTAPAAVPAKMNTWHLAPSLVQLRAEIDARWPGRSRTYDGSIGDARHSRTRNSHNPVGTKHGPRYGTRGAVHALDITASGIDTGVVLAALIGDPRVWYVIYDGRIWSRTTGWAWRRQIGDPHTAHIHVSLRDGTKAVALAAERNTARWLSVRSKTRGSRAANLTTAATHRLQRALIRRGYRIPSGATGWYGPETTKAVRAYQRDQGWSGAGADGIAGSMTLRRLGVTPGASSASKAAAKKAAKKTAAKRAAAKKAAAKRAAAKRAASKRATAQTATQRLQRALIRRGYRIPSGATGWYGPETTKAVRAFQRDQGWSGAGADGIAGSMTLRRLGVAVAPGSLLTTNPAAKAAAKKAAAKRAAAKRAAAKRAAAKRAAAKRAAAKRAAAKRAAAKRAAAKRAAAKRASAKPPDMRRADAYKPGTASVQVYYLQEALIERGFDIPAGPTGYFGPHTGAAVKAFQHSQGWSGKDADGVPGTGTLRKLGLI